MAVKGYSLSVVISAVDKISGPMRGIAQNLRTFKDKISSSAGNLSARVGLPEFRKGMGEAGDALSRAGSQFGSLARGARTAALGIGALVAVGAVAINQTVDYASAFQDLSDQTKISAEQLQGWSYGAQQSGVESEQFNSAIRDFSKNMGFAMAGTGRALPILKAMGIQFKDAQGKLKGTGDLLPEVADKIAKMKSPALQAAAASRIFGSAGVQLLPFLKQGSAGIAGMTAEARRLGLIMSNDGIAAAESFGDQLATLKAQLGGARNTLIGAMIPALSQLATQLSEAIVKYRPQIEAWAAAFAKDLPDRIDSLVGFFRDLADSLGPVIAVLSFLNDVFGLVNLAVVALSAVIIGKLIIGIVALTQALAAMGVAMTATPIGLMIAGIAALVLAGVALYRNWDKVKAVAEVVWTGIVDVVGASVDYISEKWQSLKDGVIFLFELVAKYNPFTLLAEGAKKLGESIAQYVPDWVMGGATINAPSLGADSAGARVAAAQQQKVHVVVDMNNLPKGTQVSTGSSGGAQFDVNQGWALAAP